MKSGLAIRTSAEKLALYKRHPVRIVGKIHTISSDELVLSLVNNETVRVRLNSILSLDNTSEDSIVEIIGIWIENDIIEEKVLHVYSSDFGI